jgi:hypothetical protein
MKFLIATLVFFALIQVPTKVEAQVNFNQTAYNPTGAITNAGIDTMDYKLTKGYDRILVGMTYTRATGTAAGTAILEYKIGSTDNWKADAGDTLTVTNVASQTLYWNKTVTARYWRIRVGGATTVTATVAAKLQTD